MRILIVDDREEDLYLLETLLKGNGYEVVSAKNGIKALEKLKQDSIDLIISDVLMPKMDGFQLCRECKKDDTLRKIPFIFYTATYTDKKDEEFALSLGAERFIIKPSDPDVFLKIVESVIKEYEKSLPVIPKKPIEEEEIYLKQYNERLIRKLEKKMLELEKTNKRLKESEEKYRTLVDNSPDGIFIADLEGNFLSVNRAICDNLGYSEKEIISMNMQDIIPKEYQELYKKRITKILKGEALSEPAEYEVRGKDGKEYVIEIRSAPYIKGGKIIGFQGIARDITNRKKMEEELKKSEEKYRILVETMSDGLGINDEDGRYTFVNDRLCKMLGYSPDEMIGHPVIEFLDETSKKIFKEQLKKRRRGEYKSYELVWVRKDGQKIFTIVSPRPIFDENGRFKGSFGVITDITEIKRGEEEIRKLSDLHIYIGKNINRSNTIKQLCENLLKDIKDIIEFDHANIFIHEKDKNILKPVAFYGHPKELAESVMIPYEIDEKQPWEAVKACLTKKERYIKNMQKYKPFSAYWHLYKKYNLKELYTVPLITKNELHGVLQVTATEKNPLTEEKRRLLSNISEEIAAGIAKIKAEEETRRALELEKQFKMDVAHYFFNPLAIARGYLELAMEEVPEKQRKKLKAVRHAIERVEKVVKNVTQRGEIHE